jgi:glutathione synthase/RimK-type ligase-like ATP-grasp enzyme
MMLSMVALLTERRYVGVVAATGDSYHGNILADDGLLQRALAQRGIESVRVDWADSSVDWSRFCGALFRSTWDYFHRFSEFSAWLTRVERQTKLLNVPELLWWNIDKHYLGDLEARGVPIVPSVFLEKGSDAPLTELLAVRGWDEAVLKPCISGGARHTYRLSRESAASYDGLAAELLQSEALILQPLMRSVLTGGEDSLLVFSGRVTHAVRKLARPGDFRVQDDWGGTVEPLEPSPEQIDFAQRAVAACPRPPLYARVDMVRGEDDALALMELELIEPELWLRLHPPAADALADAVAEHLPLCR